MDARTAGSEHGELPMRVLDSDNEAKIALATTGSVPQFEELVVVDFGDDTFYNLPDFLDGRRR